MSQNNEANILDYLLVLLKRKRLIAGIASGAVFLAALISFLLPKIYRADTKILPPQQNGAVTTSQLLSQLGSPLLAGGVIGMKTPNDLYTGMLRSRSVLDRVVDRFSLVSVYKVKYREDARRDLLSALKIQDDKKSGIITVGVEDRDPKRSADMANAFVEELKNLAQNIAVTEASHRRLFFEEQLKNTKETLAGSEESLRGFQERTGAIRLEDQAKALIEAIAQLRAQIAAKEIQLKVMRTYATSRNPDVQKTEEELKGTREQLSRLEAKNGGAADPLMPAGRLPGVGTEYARKVRDQKFNETLHELLLKQYEAARLDEAKEGAVIQVLDKAIPPEKKIRPKRALMIVIALVTGLFFSIMAAFFAEYREKISTDPENRDRIEKLKKYASLRSGE